MTVLHNSTQKGSIIIRISIHFTLKIGPKIVNLHILEYPFPLAGHVYKIW